MYRPRINEKPYKNGGSWGRHALPIEKRPIRGKFGTKKSTKVYSLIGRFWFFVWIYKWKVHFVKGAFKKCIIYTTHPPIEWRYI